MATASKEENSTRKAQALYVIRYQSFTLLIIPFKTGRASGFFGRPCFQPKKPDALAS